MWVKCARIILRYRIAIIIISAILTAFMGYEATKVHISYEYAAMLPETDSAFVKFQQFKKDFGSDANSFIVGFKAEKGKMFDLKTFNAFLDLCEKIDTIHGVENIISVGQAVEINGTRVDPFFKQRPQTQAELDSISAIILNQPLYEDMLFNKEGKNVYLLMISINQKIIDSPAREDLLAQLEKLVGDYSKAQNIEIIQTGMPFIRTHTSLMLQGELIIFVLLAILICVIILYLTFRSFKNVLLPMIVLTVSVIWSLGWMGMLGYELTGVTAMLPSLIIIISVPNCVFLINKFHQEFSEHGNKIKALQRSIFRVGNAIFLSNLTTAIGFSTFMITDSKILQQFGLSASLGIICVFIFSITLLPIILSYSKEPSNHMLKHLESRMFGKVVDFISLRTTNNRNAIYAITIILFLIGIYGITLMHRTGYVVDDLPQEHQIMQDLRFAENTFDGTIPLEIQIEDTAKINLIRDREFMHRMDQITDSLKTYPELGKPLSIVDILKFAWQWNNGGDPKYYTLPNSSDIFFINKLKKMVKKAGDGLGSLQYSLVDSTGKKVRIRCNVKDLGTEKMAVLEKQLEEDLSTVFPSDRYKTLITGTSVIYFKGTQYLLVNLFESLTLAIVLIAFFMALLFRSRRMVIVSLIPNVLSLFFTAALMGFLDIPIKTSTILVFNIAFGISVDNTIHFLSRYRQCLKVNPNIRESVMMTIRETSPSMISTSIILLFGFGIFGFSQFGGTQAMGILVAITLFFAMLFNNFLLPSMLLTLDKRIITQHFKEPLLDVYNEDEDIELEDLHIE